MVLILIFIIMIILMTAFFISGKNAAKSNGNYFRNHPHIVKTVLMAYVIFAGCFTFPIRSDPFPLDFMKIYLLIASYTAIGLGFAGVFEEKKEKVIYPLTVGLTAAGMICRYLLEYGEVSNTYNFTVFNIISYITVVPMYTVILYCFIVNRKVHK